MGEALQLALLESFEIICDKVTSGRQAIDKFVDDFQKCCCRKRYKIILIDLDLPDVDGYEASKQILEYQKAKLDDSGQ